MAKKRKWTDEQLVEAVKTNSSVHGVLRELGLKLSGGSNAAIKMRVRQLNLDTSHFTGKGWCRGDKHKELIDKLTYRLEDILVKDSTYQCTHRLKNRLIAVGLLDNKCAECGLDPEWNEKPLSLHLDHKDGDRCNHTISNLRILCPNCHSQTENYSGKAKRKKQAEVAQRQEAADSKSVQCGFDSLPRH